MCRHGGTARVKDPGNLVQIAADLVQGSCGVCQRLDVDRRAAFRTRARRAERARAEKACEAQASRSGFVINDDKLDGIARDADLVIALTALAAAAPRYGRRIIVGGHRRTSEAWNRGRVPHAAWSRTGGFKRGISPFAS